jgi:hypothetical protein
LPFGILNAKLQSKNNEEPPYTCVQERSEDAPIGNFTLCATLGQQLKVFDALTNAEPLLGSKDKSREESAGALPLAREPQ